MDATATLPEIKFLDTRMSRWDDLVAMAAESGVRITPETAMKTAAYFACARVVAETVGSLPLHLYRRLDDHNSERAKDLPLYNVLAKRPNRWQTRYEWVEQMCLHLGFYGNSYQFKVAGDRGSVSELRPLNPAGMKVVQEGDMSLSYVYTDPSTGRQQAYRDDQIMHVRWLSFDGIHGEVPVELGKDAIGLARALEQYAAAFYKNNAQPGIVLHTDQALPREVREQLRDQWEAAHRGPAKAGRTAILSNGLKADTVSATNQESQLAELWMQSLLAICRVWRMPPHMIQELGRATWGNLQSEMVSFEKFTIAPWLRRIEGAIERDVLPEDGDLYAEFLVEGLLRGDITSRYAAYEVAIRNGWMTPEEVRMKENLGPMPESEDDSPGEAEDTPGDAVEDVAEEDDTEDMPPEGDASTEAGDE
jgi:HK97 family phage portal protein